MGTARAASIDNGDGTVSDTVTGLMWQQQDDNQTRSWQGAITYCDGLNLAGFTDWWLPDSQELASISDASTTLPSIDNTLFPSTASAPYWSSSSATFEYGGSNAWNADFGYGDLHYSPKTDRYLVRCVRSDREAWPLAHVVGVRGTITDSSGLPLADVSVSSPSGASTTSDSHGRYLLTLAAGDIEVLFSKSGYHPITKKATVPAGRVRIVDVTCYLTGAVCGLPAKLTVPTSDADGEYTVSWGASSTNGASYIVQEATNSTFTSNLRTVYTGMALVTTIGGRTLGQTYYYRVKATKAGMMSPSDWRAGGKGCLIASPCATPATITVPAEDSDGGYTVSWGASTTAGVTYLLQEASNSTFTSGLRNAYQGPALSTDISERPAGMTLYYRVKATKAGKPPSAWRVGSNGCLIVPTCALPASVVVPVSSLNGSYAVSWGASTTPGVTYVLEEATNAAFTTDRRTLYTGTAVIFGITSRLAGKTYYYRVKATKAGVNPSAWQNGSNGCVVTSIFDPPPSPE